MSVVVLNHTQTRNLVCPFCGYEYKDSWELHSDGEDIGEMICARCEKDFYATRNILITYSSEPIPSVVK